MNFDSFINSLPAFHLIGKSAYKASLETTLLIDDYFNHPHTHFQTIHVGGTNGKGSVSHILSSILQEAGYKTGLYTSPHLYDFRERIRVNGKMIEKEAVELFLEKHHVLLETLHPSFFEMTVAMAFDYFSSQAVDIAVIEVGMGGRLDSTNIISPLISIITNIGLEHTQFLGDTIEKIAVEKAGIIKPKTPVIIGESDVATNDIFLKIALQQESPIEFADKHYLCNLDIWQEKTKRGFSIVSTNNTNTTISGVIPLGGNYQKKNLQTVVAAYNSLKSPLSLDDEDFTNGVSNVLKNTGFAGRWDIIGYNPLTICDAGHNKHGIEQIIKQLLDIPHKHLHCILGFSNDKDFDAILPLFPANAFYYFTQANNPRSCPASILKQKAAEFGLQGDFYQDITEAYNVAYKRTSTDDLIFIGGSIFLIAEINRLPLSIVSR